MKKAFVLLLLALTLLAPSACAWDLSASSENFIQNPVKGQPLAQLTVEYTISWASGDDITGSGALLAFSSADWGGRVAFHSAPCLSFRDSAGNSAQIGTPELFGSAAQGCAPGTQYAFKWVITAAGVTAYRDGAALSGLSQSVSGGYQAILDQAAAADFFFIGVGKSGHSAAYPTERCTLTNVKINGALIRF